ncbi:(2Fe-2S)-binding protein [Methylomonas sp. MO1]|uniref:(2Fe-2S)-binding protein n=1 Tax=unclassified Methylomonas TaxID=2608980 RepID=UPI0003775B54|nr:MULTISPECIES: (2Fe-2S)-binding protein [unclassified Methylomonas]MDT4289786.1 (2Fe-2S)-binding protein [Methylomonas sp. MO1]
MNAVQPNTENNVLCYCSGTTEQQIKALLAEGIVDPERISRITGAASGCGGCEFELQQLIFDHT